MAAEEQRQERQRLANVQLLAQLEELRHTILAERCVLSAACGISPMPAMSRVCCSWPPWELCSRL